MGAKREPQVRSSASGMPLYVGSIKDYRGKGCVRGGIYDLNQPKKQQLVLVVYGRTMKEMRGRKQLLLKALKEEEWHAKGARAGDRRDQAPER